MRAVVALGLVAMSAVIAGCEARPRGLAWTIAFATPDLADSVVLVEATIRRGGCSDPEIFGVDIRPGGTMAPVPPELEPGTYSFVAEGRDGMCRRVAYDCIGVDLPGETVVHNVMDAGDEATCARGVCDGGSCRSVDASVDASTDASADGGGDAARPDAPCEAREISCTNLADDDCDGATDCSDPECADMMVCSACEGVMCASCQTCVGGSCVPVAEGTACAGGSCHGGTCCTGCWDGSACRLGTDATACGGGGGACSTCPECTNCDAGSCTPALGASCPGGRCAFTGCCAGCIDGAGRCFDPGVPAACGTGGARCTACPECSNCVGGTCLPAPAGTECMGGAGHCTRDTCCTGCIDAGGNCQSGTRNGACGFGGYGCNATCACSGGACDGLGGAGCATAPTVSVAGDYPIDTCRYPNTQSYSGVCAPGDGPEVYFMNDGSPTSIIFQVSAGFSLIETGGPTCGTGLCRDATATCFGCPSTRFAIERTGGGCGLVNLRVIRP